jgi:hypothetical protein
LNTPVLLPTLPGMAKKPEPEQAEPISWTIYKVAAKLRPLGIVEATNADEAIEKGAVEYKIPANKLIAIRRP